MLKKIIVEVPTSWIDNPVDGYKHQRFICNFLIALASRSVPISLIKVPYGADTAPRCVHKGELIFSYHSHGPQTNVWHMKEAPITPLFGIDKQGYSGWADIVDIERYRPDIESMPLDQAQAIISRYQQFFAEKGASKYPQSESQIPVLPDKFVFFPLQVQDDPVSELSQLNALDMLQTAADLALARGFHLVVKRHPFCNSRAIEMTLARLMAENPQVLQVDANIHTLIKQAHAVITVNSGVGLEALLDGAAVYCSGLSEWYQAANPLVTLDDLAAAFDDRPVYMNAFQQKLVAYLVSVYWQDPSDISALDKRIQQCISEFDANYGLDGPPLAAAEVLMPIVLDLQGRLEYEMRRAKLAMIDLSVALAENDRQRETFDSVRRISQQNMQLEESSLFQAEENSRLQQENLQLLHENQRLEERLSEQELTLRAQRDALDQMSELPPQDASEDDDSSKSLVDRLFGKK